MSVPLRSTIARLDLFAGAGPEDVDAVAALAVEQRFKEGETIFSRGAPGGGMLIVLQGTIRLSIVSVEGRELILREAGPGDVIGEIAVIDGGRRSADATALGPVVAGFIGQAPFARLLAARPTLQMPILQVLCVRLRETTDQLESIALYPLEARLARFLLWHVKRYGRTRADGARSAPLTISQSAIASFVGASRPKVNRLLASFEERGAIERRGAIVHCDVAALARLAQADVTQAGEMEAGVRQDADRG
jgi:CRP/FNR family transcriptional regulator, cyclic AMP receptor protein